MSDATLRTDVIREIDAYLRETDPLVGGTSYNRVHNVIRRDILSGKFAAGARLKTAELSRRYGVSPVPIREALQKLSGEGIVAILPNRGARVRCINADFIAEIHQLRILLVSHMTSTSVAHLSDADLDRLETIEEIYEEYLRQGETRLVSATNHIFHQTLESGSRSDLMKLTLRNYSELLQTLRFEIGFSDARRAETAAEHRELLAAARARDSAAATEIITRHIRHGCRDFLEQLRRSNTFAPVAGGLASDLTS